MMSNIDKRIEKIKANRKTLLSMVRKSINHSKTELSSDMQDLAFALNVSEANDKKYIEILKLRKAIEDLAHRIMRTSSKDEIMQLRKELNKMIAKVRKEIKDRDIHTADFEGSVTSLRKDIAKYIRVCKRVDTLDVIDDYYSRKDSLSDEERKEFRKLLNRERSYNTRSINEMNKKKLEVDQSTPVEIVPGGSIFDLGVNTEEDSDLGLDITPKKDTPPLDLGLGLDITPKKADPAREIRLDLGLPDTQDTEKREPVFNLDITPKKSCGWGNLLEHAKDDEDYVSQKVSIFNQKFHITPLHTYSKSVPRNVINFFRNIPIFMRNRRNIRPAYYELSVTKPSALIGYVEYQRASNSFLNGLLSIFSKSSLYTIDEKYETTHSRCVDWILGFCEANDLDFFYEKTM